jgi:hypothetical protein
MTNAIFGNEAPFAPLGLDCAMPLPGAALRPAAPCSLHPRLSPSRPFRPGRVQPRTLPELSGKDVPTNILAGLSGLDMSSQGLCPSFQGRTCPPISWPAFQAWACPAKDSARAFREGRAHQYPARPFRPGRVQPRTLPELSGKDVPTNILAGLSGLDMLGRRPFPNHLKFLAIDGRFWRLIGEFFQWRKP